MTDFIRAYIDHLRAADRSTRTITAREQLLRRVDALLAPYGLIRSTSDELERLVSRWTGWTLYTYWEGLYAFYAFASNPRRREHLDINPMDDMTRPRTPQRDPRPMREQEIAHALYKLRDPWRRGVLLATLNGLRCAEICGLDREHVDQADLRITRKGGKVQTLPTHPDVWHELAGLPPGPVVRTERGGRFNPTAYSGCTSEALTAIGLPEATLHRFRASFATRLADQGTHVTVIQKLMNHARLTTTQQYVEVREEQRRLAISTLPLPANSQQEAA